MLLKILCAALLCVHFEDTKVEGKIRFAEEELEYIGQQYLNHLQDDDDSSDDSQEDDTEDLDPIRLKGLKSKSSWCTPSDQEVSRVREAIKEMLLGNENLFTPITFKEKNDKKSIPDKRAIEYIRTRTQSTAEKYGKSIKVKDLEENDYQNEIDNEIIGSVAINVPTRSPPPALRTEGVEILSEDVDPGRKPENVRKMSHEETSIDDEEKLPPRTSNRAATNNVHTANTKESLTTETTEFTEAMTTTKARRMTTKPTTKFRLDVPALLQVIAKLTSDYKMKLADNLNKTLLQLSEKAQFFEPDANGNDNSTEVVAKCYVCGLEEPGIPRQAQCSDAFARDWLPTAPVDFAATRKKPKYKKHCRYLDVDHYEVNSSMPHSVFGRWSGGCSVRWIDVSGVYTQRSCRNRLQPVTGRHFASKRMAKLEMALNKMDNGCISSPMASLVPLSRGISLYARFHACVCTGNWCNMASISSPWTALGLVIYTSVCCCKMSKFV